MPRYMIRKKNSGEPWQEVDAEEYAREERNSGFYAVKGQSNDTPVTSRFISSWGEYEGRVQYNPPPKEEEVIND